MSWIERYREQADLWRSLALRFEESGQHSKAHDAKEIADGYRQLADDAQERSDRNREKRKAENSNPTRRSRA